MVLISSLELPWLDAAMAVILLVGSLFCLVAAIGLLRFEDVFLRLHASTKAGTLGVGLIMIVAAVGFATTESVARALATVFFILLTAPVAGHMIARAAYAAGTRLSRATVLDEREHAADQPVRIRFAAE